MIVKSLLCAENIIRDAESGQITIYNLLDDISSPAYPLLIPRFSIYIFCEKSSAEETDNHQICFKIFNNDTQLFADNINIKFNGKLRNRGIIKFNGIAVQTPGLLTIRVFKNDETTLLKEESVILSLLSNKPEVKAG